MKLLQRIYHLNSFDYECNDTMNDLSFRLSKLIRGHFWEVSNIYHYNSNRIILFLHWLFMNNLSLPWWAGVWVWLLFFWGAENVLSILCAKRNTPGAQYEYWVNDIERVGATYNSTVVGSFVGVDGDIDGSNEAINATLPLLIVDKFM